MTVLRHELYDGIQAELDASAEIFRAELRSDLPFVNELCEVIDRYHGKRVRPAVLLLAGRACGRLIPAHPVLAAVVEMVHIATLVHDDVLDEAETRRHLPTICRMQGNEAAVLLGDVLFSHAYHLCSGLESQFAARQIGRTAVALCEGELLQVSNRERFDLDEETYFEIIRRKTASLIATSCLLGAHYAGADEGQSRRMAAFGEALGIAFQIRDDLLDLTGDASEVGKTLGCDIEKGKLTLPLIHHLREVTAADHAETIRLLTNAGEDREARIVERLRASDSLEYAAERVQAFVRSALEQLDGLPDSGPREALRVMAEFVASRTY